MTFAGRVLKERMDLAIEDPGGEREAVAPLMTPLTWDHLIATRVLPERSKDLEEQLKLWERIAVALEQVALELWQERGSQSPSPAPQPIAPPVQYQSAPAPFMGNAIPLTPPQCPLHGKDWRGPGKNGRYYCATKMADGSWCKQSPQAYASLP